MADMPEKMSICRAKESLFRYLVAVGSTVKNGCTVNLVLRKIIDDCDHYVFMGGNNYETAKTLSLKLNVPLE